MNYTLWRLRRQQESRRSRTLRLKGEPCRRKWRRRFQNYKLISSIIIFLITQAFLQTSLPFLLLKANPPFHYRLFQKVDQWMNKDEQLDNDAKKRLEDANQVRWHIIYVKTSKVELCFIIEYNRRIYSSCIKHCKDSLKVWNVLIIVSECVIISLQYFDTFLL